MFKKIKYIIEFIFGKKGKTFSIGAQIECAQFMLYSLGKNKKEIKERNAKNSDAKVHPYLLIFFFFHSDHRSNGIK
mgnify:CR=1 FL=1